MSEMYKKELMYKSNSVISGKIEKPVEVGDENLPWAAKVIQAFLADDELQEMTIVSANIGFIKTLTKIRA